MINQILKLGIFVGLGLWLKHRGKGLLLLIFVLFVTWLGHNEYIEYASQAGDTQYLAVSYAVKWFIFIIACGIYYLTIERRLKSTPDANSNVISHPETSPPKGDGFDFLRRKRKLESEKDKMLKGFRPD